ESSASELALRVGATRREYGWLASSYGARLRLFRRALEPGQRFGRLTDEEPAERRLNQPTPPTWRELECSVERHAAGVRGERRDANDFIVGDPEWQANAERQILRADCLA